MNTVHLKIKTLLLTGCSLWLLNGCLTDSNTKPVLNSQTSAQTDSTEAGKRAIMPMSDKVIQAALPWQDQPYRVGTSEQCMNWTREVLVQACGEKFSTLETQHPWDGHLLGASDALLPEHADSLAGDELGTKIDTINALQRGDLVFFKNTYGNWAEGVLTHVGIAMGDGTYIHRMTSNKGLVKITPIPVQEFSAGIRLNQSLCQ